MKVLVVLTSHDQLGNTGRKTGFWLEELAAPYYAFRDVGAEITLASPKGGRPPLDPKSNEPEFRTDLTLRFERDAAAGSQLEKTVRVDSVRQEDFDTVFYPGGHGPMWDLAEDREFDQTHPIFPWGRQADRDRVPFDGRAAPRRDVGRQASRSRQGGDRIHKWRRGSCRPYPDSAISRGERDVEIGRYLLKESRLGAARGH